jgi:D-serine deaminase-like pyridoxal phosphate-dependent protein
MTEIVRLLINSGIEKYKCATIAEAEMTAAAGAADILLAVQPVGPNFDRFFELKRRFPSSGFSCIADCGQVIRELSVRSVNSGTETAIWLDLNTGMDRTGITPGKEAADLYRLMTELPGLRAEGLHAYDGHIHDHDLSVRKQKCEEAWSGVTIMINEISRFLPGKVRVVAGGSPTFPIHAAREGVETSPGTVILWDYGYGSGFTDMNYLCAAILLSRVISKPADDLICIDLGHKAVASEMPHPRVKLCRFENYEFVAHNEEHLVIRLPEARKMKVGDVVYCIPWHICPTVDRHDKAWVIEDGRVTGQWSIEARKRKISI